MRAATCLLLAAAAGAGAAVSKSIGARSRLTCGAGTQLVGNTCIGLPSDAGTGLSCAPGTVQIGEVCVVEESAPNPDAGSGAGTVGLPVGDDAGTSDEAGSEATTIGIDAAHHNAQPFDAVASPLTPVWTLRFDGGVLYPLIVHGMAIVSIAGPQPNLRAVDLNTGALRWGPLATGQPVQLAYGNGAVFALDGTGNLTAFDVSTGARLWSTRIDALLAGFGPVFSNGLVYVNGVGGGGVTYAFNARDGKLVWTALTGAGSAGAVAVGGGIVYEAEGCHTVFAFDAATGQLTWTAGSDCGMGATPSVYQDAIYATDTGSTALFGLGGEQRGSLAAATRPAFHAGTAFFLGIGMNPSPTLFAQDIATGAVKWSFASDLFLCSSPVVAGAGGQVFIASASGNLYELDEATGAVRSVTKAAASLECEDGNLTLGAGRLLVIAPNQLIAY